MDEFGECIRRRCSGSTMKKKAKEMEALESMYPDDFFTLVQGVDTAGNRTPRFKKISLVPKEPAG